MNYSSLAGSASDLLAYANRAHAVGIKLIWGMSASRFYDGTDLRRFYPTDVCVTARDIIFLWVARMIFMGLRFTDTTPFADVIITSTVQATDGTRMNKSKGNAVDPLAMIEEHGASILYLAGARNVVSCKARKAEVVQPRKLPDGLLEARLRSRAQTRLFLVEVATYPEERVVQQIRDDIRLVGLDQLYVN